MSNSVISVPCSLHCPGILMIKYERNLLVIRLKPKFSFGRQYKYKCIAKYISWKKYRFCNVLGSNHMFGTNFLWALLSIDQSYSGHLSAGRRTNLLWDQQSLDVLPFLINLIWYGVGSFTVASHDMWLGQAKLY
jgi:hypothetical protein